MAILKISSDLQNVIKKVVLDTYFPVGSLYLTVGSENPNNTIGGTWAKLSGYYLYADTSINNTSYTGKHTQSHTLTTDQIPAHGHPLKFNNTSADGSNRLMVSYAGGSYKTLELSSWNWVNSNANGNIFAENIGGGKSHNHNIATKGIYVWQRTK